MAVTIRDVAAVAGVSISTVSRAMSDGTLVRPDTRQRVIEVAAELGYQPNRAARGLITGRTGNIGLILPDLTNPFFPGVVKGVQARARQADHAVFIADTDEDPQAEFGLVKELAKQVDGVLLCSPRMSERQLRSVLGLGPLVLLNRRVYGIPSVTIDSADAIRQAVEHLTALGHDSVAYVAGPKGSWSNRERLRALRRAVPQAGMRLIETGRTAPTFEGGLAAADAVLASGASAVVAYNDLVALGLVQRFAASGVAVPDDVSVIGFDDIFVAAMATPGLTTLTMPNQQIGQAGVELLLQLMNQPDQRRLTRELTSTLKVRQTTGPPPNHRKVP